MCTLRRILRPVCSHAILYTYTPTSTCHETEKVWPSASQTGRSPSGAQIFRPAVGGQIIPYCSKPEATTTRALRDKNKHRLIRHPKLYGTKKQIFFSLIPFFVPHDSGFSQKKGKNMVWCGRFPIFSLFQLSCFTKAEF